MGFEDKDRIFVIGSIAVVIVFVIEAERTRIGGGNSGRVVEGLGFEEGGCGEVGGDAVVGEVEEAEIGDGGEEEVRSGFEEGDERRRRVGGMGRRGGGDRGKTRVSGEGGGECRRDVELVEEAGEGGVGVGGE